MENTHSLIGIIIGIEYRLMSEMSANGNLTRTLIAFIKAIARTFYMSQDVICLVTSSLQVYL